MTKATYRIRIVRRRRHSGRDHGKAFAGPDLSVIKNMDLFAGASTGSIIAIGLASGVTIDTIVELYSSQKACSKIFQPYLPSAEQDRLGRAFADGEQALIVTSEAPADLGDRLRELGPLLLFPKYRSDGLRELLATYVPDITLADVWTWGAARIIETPG